MPGAATPNALEGYVGFMSNSVDFHAAGDRPFTLVLDFTGPGGGMYTIRVEDGAAGLSDGAPHPADVRMSLDPVTFNCVMIRPMSSPMLAMLTGRINVKGVARMSRMQKIFREPKLDDRLTGALFA